jgi:hypothetical protein
LSMDGFLNGFAQEWYQKQSNVDLETFTSRTGASPDGNRYDSGAASMTGVASLLSVASVTVDLGECRYSAPADPTARFTTLIYRGGRWGVGERVKKGVGKEVGKGVGWVSGLGEKWEGVASSGVGVRVGGWGGFRSGERDSGLGEGGAGDRLKEEWGKA